MNRAYIARGKLYLLDEEGRAEEVYSEFAQKQEGEAARRHKYSPWQRSEGSPAFGGMNIWGGHADASNFATYRFTDVLRIDENRLLYLLSSGTVTGVFEYDIAEKSERRLVHRSDFQFHGVDYDPESGKLCVGQLLESGATDIELRSCDGRVLGQLTAGDSADSNPRFSLKDRDVIVFQSSGIARMDDGGFHSFGPSGINRMNLADGSMEELLANHEYDYLTPREGPSGEIYCIRRPAHSHLHQPLWHSVRNFLLFPFFFVQAVFNFLTLFTELFKNTPALAGGPRNAGPPPEQHLTVLGRAINLGKSRSGGKEDGEEALVPLDWELIRVDGRPDGDVIARGVCSFDVDRTGALTYTNGFKIFEWVEGERKIIGKYELVEQVRSL